MAKLKCIAPYMAGSVWVEVFYHLPDLLVVDGVVETDDELAIETLLRHSYIPFEEWEAQEAERAERERAADEANREKLAEAARLIEAAKLATVTLTGEKPSRKAKKADESVQDLLSEGEPPAEGAEPVADDVPGETADEAAAVDVAAEETTDDA